jgi:hypothetical protein
MTAAEFENLDELEAELWLVGRFRSFVSQGFPPTLALAFAVHPDIAAPVDEASFPLDMSGENIARFRSCEANDAVRSLAHS